MRGKYYITYGVWWRVWAWGSWGGEGGSWMAWHLDGLDRVAFMVYFWFGWNNRMGISGRGLMRCWGGNRTGQEQERGVGVWSTGKSLLASRGNHRYTTHPSFPFRVFPLTIWAPVGGCKNPASFLHRRRTSDHNSTPSAVCPAPAPSTDFRGPSPQHGADGINTKLEAEENGTM